MEIVALSMDFVVQALLIAELVAKANAVCHTTPPKKATLHSITSTICVSADGSYLLDCVGFAYVRATGDWTVDSDDGHTKNKTTWDPAEPLGLMAQQANCDYAVTVCH